MRKNRRPPYRVCFPFAGDTIGGSHLSALLLIGSLDRRKYDPIIVLHQLGALSSYLDELGIAYELLPLSRFVKKPYDWRTNISAILPPVLSLTKFLLRSHVDIVHTNDARMQLLWPIPARLARCRVVWHQRTRGFAKYNHLKRTMLASSSSIICVSSFAAESVPNDLRARMTIVRNPFRANVEKLCSGNGAAAATETFSEAPDSTVVGFFANLEARKRPLVFVRAAAALSERLDRPLLFPLFGADKEGNAEKVRKLAHELGVADEVRLVGFKTPVEPWLAACDIMLVPAINEGFGRTLIEAMMVGTPIVAAKSGAHPEIIEDGVTGLLVPPDDHEAMAQAVLRLVTDPELATGIASRAEQKVMNAYSVEAHASKVMAVYDQVLGLAA